MQTIGVSLGEHCHQMRSFLRQVAGVVLVEFGASPTASYEQSSKVTPIESSTYGSTLKQVKSLPTDLTLRLVLPTPK